MGFDELLGEYPAQYRNSMRCLVRCEELAASLFQRLKYVRGRERERRGGGEERRGEDRREEGTNETLYHP